MKPRYALQTDHNQQESAFARTCPYCNGFMHQSNKRVKTCGQAACRDQHALAKGTKETVECKGCGELFVAFTTAKRQYCSYDCHLDNGGALRAGNASARATRLCKKKDLNHNVIVKALEKCGVQVIDTSTMGYGFPDLICCVHKETLLVEIKNPDTSYGRKGLNPLQKKFAQAWKGGPVYIVRTNEDVENMANMRLEKLEHYGGL